MLIVLCIFLMLHFEPIKFTLCRKRERERERERERGVYVTIGIEPLPTNRDPTAKRVT
jgi:hypothetical protein